MFEFYAKGNVCFFKEKSLCLSYVISSFMFTILYSMSIKKD